MTGPAFDALHTLVPPLGRDAAGSSLTVRGFALYVGAGEQEIAGAGLTLQQVVAALRRRLEALAPDAEVYSSIVVAPAGVPADDLEVVRQALRVPHYAPPEASPAPERHAGAVVIDLSRASVAVDGAPVALTYREFQLLRALVTRAGRPVSRDELIPEVWSGANESAPSARTVDVMIRRVRDKLGDYRDIVRTARGSGYRFDEHADVAVLRASTPSPDRL